MYSTQKMTTEKLGLCVMSNDVKNKKIRNVSTYLSDNNLINVNGVIDRNHE